MKLTAGIRSKLNWVDSSIYFFRKHFWMIFGLGLIAACGRTIQLGAFGPISSWINIALEIIIESARMAIVLYVLGLANIRKGWSRFRRLLTNRSSLRQNISIALDTLKRQWFTILVNILLFSVIAWVLNYLIDALAYQTCLYITLKRQGILSEHSSEWVILLFFKNISVIPFTLVFNGLFALWVTKKIQTIRPVNGDLY